MDRVVRATAGVCLSVYRAASVQLWRGRSRTSAGLIQGRERTSSLYLGLVTGSNGKEREGRDANGQQVILLCPTPSMFARSTYGEFGSDRLRNPLKSTENGPKNAQNRHISDSDTNVTRIPLIPSGIQIPDSVQSRARFQGLRLVWTIDQARAGRYNVKPPGGRPGRRWVRRWVRTWVRIRDALEWPIVGRKGG